MHNGYLQVTSHDKIFIMTMHKFWQKNMHILNNLKSHILKIVTETYLYQNW